MKNEKLMNSEIILNPITFVKNKGKEGRKLIVSNLGSINGLQFLKSFYLKVK